MKEAMERAEGFGELAEHLERTMGLSRSEALRVIDEVVNYFSETVDEFVRRRHAELRADGLRNEAIYDRIREELHGRRFAAPPLTRRQVRRMIYG